MKGLVVKNTGSWYTVRTDDGQLLDCKIKGSFRLKGIRSTNPVAVGDRVTITTPPSKGGAGGGSFITDIEDRRNYIIRKSINLSKQSHILAANVDQAFLVVTVIRPETSTTFIDRFLASAEAYSVPVVLIFNKTDLLDDETLRYQEALVNLYETVGYECRQISAETGTGVDELRPLLSGKITLLSGNSGVGKSTLINRLVPGANLRTADISEAHQTGQHTTTFSEMIPLDLSPLPVAHSSLPIAHSSDAPPECPTVLPSVSPSQPECQAVLPSGPSPSASSESGGFAAGSLPLRHTEFAKCCNAYLIDTPGIKGFGTFDMEREELTSYFKEIFYFSKDCRFSNCTHTHEPGCAVLKAVEDHYIAQSRYQSYLSMLEDKDENRYREAY